jgi:hypothetical protein
MLQIRTRHDENSPWAPWDYVPAEAISVVHAQDVQVVTYVYGKRPHAHH